MVHKDLYEIQGDKLVRKRRICPKCGEGTFLAQHKNRESCGKCSYTEFTKKEEPATRKPKEELPATRKPKEELPATRKSKEEPLSPKETKAELPASKEAKAE